MGFHSYAVVYAQSSRIVTAVKNGKEEVLAQSEQMRDIDMFHLVLCLILGQDRIAAKDFSEGAVRHPANRFTSTSFSFHYEY